MINDDDLGSAIAANLANFWNTYKGDVFRSHITSTFGITIDAVPDFNRLCIVRCEGGNIQRGDLVTIYSQLWKVDDSGFGPYYGKAFSEQVDGCFFKNPIIHFYFEKDLVLIGELLGPSFVTRRRGKLLFEAGALKIADLNTVWTSAASAQSPLVTTSGDCPRRTVSGGHDSGIFTQTQWEQFIYLFDRLMRSEW